VHLSNGVKKNRTNEISQSSFERTLVIILRWLPQTGGVTAAPLGGRGRVGIIREPTFFQ
jgi:hypothetical protein